ncbi:MAG: heteromeric transposase endonuclease subunit TnsA [Geobacter sp.]|nr:MAG: heteromeric transposase endonuclease subunit TnsA [Geobacter sp.]
MPVRKIPKSFRSVRGQFPSVKNGRSMAFESTIERDFFLSLEFDSTVQSYEEQPVQISGLVDGKEASYTPDCLVSYNNGRPPMLAEVKSAEELEKPSPSLQRRLTLARQYADANGMAFQVIKDADIRSSRLETYRFLYGFSTPPRELASHRLQIITITTSVGEITLRELLEKLSPDRTIQAAFTPIIWHLLFTGELIADLNLQIGYSTILRASNDHHLP